jgi:ATP-binding cassette, subfamily B, bacterial PglK
MMRMAWWPIGRLLTPRQRGRMALVIAGSFIAAALETVGVGAIPAFVTLLIEPARMLAPLPDVALTAFLRQAEPRTLMVAGAAVLAVIFVVKNLYLIGLNYFELRLLRDIDVHLSTRLFRAYLHSPYAFHLQRNPAELMRNVESATTHSVAFMEAHARLLREGLVLSVIFSLLVVLDPIVSISVFLLMTGTAALFYLSFRRVLTRRGALAQQHRARQLQAINQGLGAIKDAKILGRESFLLDAFATETSEVKEHELHYRLVSGLPRLILEVVAITAVVVVAVMFTLMDRSAQLMLPVLALFGVATVRLVPAFNQIGTSVTRIRYERPAFDLVVAELAALEETQEPHATDLDGERNPVARCIRVEEVQYTYPGASAPALAGVTLEVRRGDAVALVGPSGAGKSTLVDVILGLLVPDRGTITVDGQDIRAEMRGWQRQIGYVPQDIYLLDESIRRNVAFGMGDEDIDDEAVAAALEAAQLTSFVAALPAGLQTEVGNRGIRLSGGQRQRLGIARALYHNPSVLVMDEATSALDHDTELDLIEAIEKLRGDRTLIIIAHRLTTIEHCDHVYMLKDGRVYIAGPYAAVAEHIDVALRRRRTGHAEVG